MCDRHMSPTATLKTKNKAIFLDHLFHVSPAFVFLSIFLKFAPIDVSLISLLSLQNLQYIQLEMTTYGVT